MCIRDRDVPCEDIVNKAIETNAAVIGLSALMTTTMMRMKDVVEICKEKGCKSKVVTVSYTHLNKM